MEVSGRRVSPGAHVLSFARRRRKWEFDVGPRCQGADRPRHIAEVLSDEAPICSLEHEDGEAPIRKILLVAKVLIGRDDCRKAFGFGGVQQLAILQVLPTALKGCDNLMIGQCLPQRRWRALIEQKLHVGSGRFEAALGVLEHGLDLLACDAGEPFEKLLYGRTAFDVLEERLHGHTGIFEKPGTADFSGNALYRRTLCPIEHGGHTMVNFRPECKRRAPASLQGFSPAGASGDAALGHRPTSADISEEFMKFVGVACPRSCGSSPRTYSSGAKTSARSLLFLDTGLV